jgi:hypothetical protein
MARRPARPLPRDLDRDVVKASFAELLATDPASPWDDYSVYQMWSHSLARMQGFDLGYLSDALRTMVTTEPRDDETETETVRRAIRLQVAVHGDCSVSFWAGLMSVVMLTTPGFVETVLRWRETAPDLKSMPRARPRRIPNPDTTTKDPT